MQCHKLNQKQALRGKISEKFKKEAEHSNMRTDAGKNAHFGALLIPTHFNHIDSFVLSEPTYSDRDFLELGGCKLWLTYWGKIFSHLPNCHEFALIL